MFRFKSDTRGHTIYNVWCIEYFLKRYLIPSSRWKLKRKSINAIGKWMLKAILREDKNSFINSAKLPDSDRLRRGHSYLGVGQLLKWTGEKYSILIGQRRELQVVIRFFGICSVRRFPFTQSLKKSPRRGFKKPLHSSVKYNLWDELSKSVREILLKETQIAFFLSHCQL